MAASEEPETLDQHPLPASDGAPSPVEAPLETSAEAVGEPATVETVPVDGTVEAGIAAPMPVVAPPVAAIVEAGVTRILDAFERKIAYDAAKQRQIDQLHDEVQRHRAGLVSQATRGVVQGVIRLHDDIGKLATSLRARPAEELTPTRLLALFAGLQEDVEILLEQQGVSAYREIDDRFNSRRQRAVRSVPTDDPARAGMVAERLRPGFTQGEEILEKERVAAYVHRPDGCEPAPVAPSSAECGQTRKET